MEPRAPLTLALAGQPNVGKSTVFNALTGLNQHVGNWPGKTVEQKTGRFEHDGRQITLVDLPGTYSLTSGSEEERVTRDYLISEPPAAVLAVVNASSLERNLYLVAELLTLPVPVVIGLNMLDVAEAHGIHRRGAGAGRGAGRSGGGAGGQQGPGSAGVHRRGRAPGRAPRGVPPQPPGHPAQAPSRAARARGPAGGPHPGRLPARVGVSEAAGGRCRRGPAGAGGRPRRLGTGERASWPSTKTPISTSPGAATTGWGGWSARRWPKPKRGVTGITDHIDRVATHPLWGLLVLIAAFGAMFWITYAVANPAARALSGLVSGDLSTWLHGVLDWAPAWLSGVLVDGVVAGAGHGALVRPHPGDLLRGPGAAGGRGLHGPGRLRHGPLHALDGAARQVVHAAAAGLRLQRAGHPGDAHHRGPQGPHAHHDAHPVRALHRAIGGAGLPGAGLLRRGGGLGGGRAGGGQPHPPGHRGRDGEQGGLQGGEERLHHGDAALPRAQRPHHRPVRVAEHPRVHEEGRYAHRDRLGHRVGAGELPGWRPAATAFWDTWAGDWSPCSLSWGWGIGD